MRYLLALLFLIPLAGCGNQSADEAPPNDLQATSSLNRKQRAYEEAFDKWQGLLQRLLDLDVEYRTTHPSLREPIEDRYQAVVDEAEAHQAELIDAAVIAFADEPSERQDLAQFLLGVLRMDMQTDRYEDALRLAQLLIDNEVRMPSLYNLAGVAAFNSNQFALAEKHLQRAREEHALNDQGREALRSLPYYKEAWAREQELRQAEKAAGNLPRVVLDTNKGEIELELFEDQAPNTVANFISLVENGFYDGLMFHRVKEDFMAQAGDPEGDGTGGPGYTIRCEVYEDDARKHFRGSLAMAHRGPHTGGSQFYIAFKPLRQLDNRHTVFGRVVRGMDVLAKLQRREPRDPIEKKINPHRNIIIPTADRIEDARVIRKRDHDYVPQTRRAPKNDAVALP